MTEQTRATSEPAPFDFGPFTKADWDWLLGEARKRHSGAVVFYHPSSHGTAALVARLPDGDCCHVWSSLKLKNVTLIFGDGPYENVFEKARSERRIYPTDYSGADPGSAAPAPESPQSVATAKAYHCIECSSPATHELEMVPRCAYCWARSRKPDDHTREFTDRHPTNVAARAAIERREQPRVNPAEAAMLQRGRDTARWYEVPGDETP